MNTISHIAKKFNLSRSTLLYYDSIGVLSPGHRSSSGYRVYSTQDIQKLEKICKFREAGLPLEEIKKLLKNERSDTNTILEKHLETLNREISKLRHQQHILIQLLKDKKLTKKLKVMNKETWKKVLRSTGLSDSEMDDWHRSFEEIAPESHQDFLESLGIGSREIKKIRNMK